MRLIDHDHKLQLRRPEQHKVSRFTIISPSSPLLKRPVATESRSADTFTNLQRQFRGVMDSNRQAVNLPDSLWFRILELLDFRSRVVCERVCRQLNGLLRKPGIWNDIQLTLEQLVGADNREWTKDLRTPAARWTLARMTREIHPPSEDRPSNRTWLHLRGHASCLAEGLSVPWFFALLDAVQMDYSVKLELTGYPRES
ncbi:hypothetical protein WJX73_004958 [Symbiochloris irregularis]|uniref:F-box domain-containing protein n=1 Tax=Symbiochloris irregularis TaxID=706552 RepID=A0AAW1NFI4_9CHLO